MAHTFKSRFVIRILILICLVAVLPGGLVLAAPGDTTRVSVDSTGAQANGASRWATISSNGVSVVFASEATNLVAGDTNGVEDIFVRNRQTGVTERVSLADDESQANGWSEGSAISADGRYVAFVSSASNLIGGDTNGILDVFVRDRQLGQTKRVSVDSSGTQASGDPWSSYGDLAISSDGRFVTFASDVTNLVSGDTNGARDIFVHDMQTGATIRASVDSSGAQANGPSTSSDMSSDGSLIAFASNATNLVPDDTNGKADIFLHNILTGATTRISVSSSGAQADKGSSEPDISDTGRYVAFSSDAENLLPGFEVYEHVYIRDLTTGDMARASVWSSGDPMVGWAMYPTLSADGRYVAFEYDDRGDGDGVLWIYVHDRLTGQTTSATKSGRGDENTAPIHPSFSADGNLLLFESGNATLVSGDTNGVSDIFVREGPYDSNPPPSPTPNLPPSPTPSPVPNPIPTVVSITRADPNPAFAMQNVRYTVSFSEPVTGVDVGDFGLAKAGITGAANVTGVSGWGSTYTVTVYTGNGQGAFRLDLVDNDSIRDAVNQPLGGTGAGNGNFSAGGIYNIFVLYDTTYRSNGGNDGWVVESSEDTNLGGSLNSTADTFYLGDNAQDRQFRAFLHFPTYTLQDNVVIVRATLKLKRQSVFGTDPFTTHGNVLVDIRYGPFSGANDLQVIDFQAPASRNTVGAFFNTPSGDWYSATLDPAAFPSISLIGVTQFRLAFQLDDNDDLGADTIPFYSGDYGDLAYRPQLQILYYVP